MAESPKILLYDLEISGSVAHVFDHYETNVLAYEKPWEILSVAYKWLGEPRIHCISQRKNTEKEIVHFLHELFDESDFLIAHNGNSFDWKKTNAKFIQFGLKPPSPSVCIDTKLLAKKYFKFNSNSLNELGDFLKIGKKISTGGYDLWLGCIRGKKKSWDLMEKYNKRDVSLLEKLYLKLRPWIYKQPGISIAQSHIQCSSCEGYAVHKRGIMRTLKGPKQRYQCQKCGAWALGKLIKEEN